jgi:hypothetical protein
VVVVVLQRDRVGVDCGRSRSTRRSARNTPRTRPRWRREPGVLLASVR